MIRTIVVRMNVKILDTMAMIWTHDRNDDDDVGARMSGWRPSSMSHHCKHPGPKIAKCRCDDECRWKADVMTKAAALLCNRFGLSSPDCF